MNAKEYESPIYTQYVAEITRAFSKQMNKEFGLICTATGGEMPHDVEVISLQFTANRSATIDEARELEVRVTEQLIQMVNAHEKIRPFLREYPFTSSRADVGIDFEKPKNTQITQNYVDLVFQAKNRIMYRAENPNNPNLYIGVKDEPYEEALKIVQNSPSKLVTHKPKWFWDFFKRSEIKWKRRGGKCAGD
ncbi:MAG: hypothetical protein HYX67_06650 [Candidatus Melainabacteria bacterium]|nr:hypothetical protein [Candidatus Melainabacteria bacterium]